MFPLMLPFIKCSLYVAYVAMTHHTSTYVCVPVGMLHPKCPAGSQATTVHSSLMAHHHHLP